MPGEFIYVTYSMQTLKWSSLIRFYSWCCIFSFVFCVSSIQPLCWILFLHSIYPSKNSWPLQLRDYHLQLLFLSQYLDKISLHLSLLSHFDSKTYSFSHIFLIFMPLVAFFAWQFQPSLSCISFSKFYMLFSFPWRHLFPLVIQSKSMTLLEYALFLYFLLPHRFTFFYEGFSSSWFSFCSCI